MVNAALLLEVLALAGAPLVDEVPEDAALSVEETTAEVADRETVDVPCSTSKYMP